MLRRLLAVTFLAALCSTGCATVEEIEEPGVAGDVQDGGFTNPAAREGDFELDRELCWQSIQPSSPSPEGTQQAHEACMREKGWTQAD